LGQGGVTTLHIKRLANYEILHKVSRQHPVAGSCDHDTEPSGSVKGGEFD